MGIDAHFLSIVRKINGSGSFRSCENEDRKTQQELEGGMANNWRRMSDGVGTGRKQTA